MIEVLENIIGEIFNKNGYNKVRIIKSNRLDLCDYQCNEIFKIAKENNQNPSEIGNKIVEEINKLDNFSEYFSKVEFIKPGFINISVSDNLINKMISKMFNDEHFNLKKEADDLYFLDYGGPNIAKPLHVGHLRPAIIGESVKRIINFVGCKTISDVHLGDFGLQIGEVIYGIKNEKKNINDIDLEYLEYIYPKMSKLCKEDKDVMDECAKITKDLQDGNEEYIKLWKVICNISGNDIKRIYDYLDVQFDLWNGESDSYKYIENVTKLLEENNLLKNSQGAKIVDVSIQTDKKEVPPLIYQKSNGAYLYSTTDLASIYERVTKYNPKHIFYVVDARQSLHFTQVFRTCEKLELTRNIDFKFLGLGTVNGSDGKPFKTRSGDSVKLDFLFNEVKEFFVESREENKKMPVSDLDKIVNSIIKFADLQNNRERDYIFDISKFSSISGKTGPYILYTYLRIKKILDGEQLNITDLNETIYNTYDRDLRMKLLDLNIYVENAFKELLPSYIADYLYDLCVIDNIFYQNNHIKTTDDNFKKQEWLLLLTLNNKIIEQLLYLLIIKIPSQM